MCFISAAAATAAAVPAHTQDHDYLLPPVGRDSPVLFPVRSSPHLLSVSTAFFFLCAQMAGRGLGAEGGAVAGSVVSMNGAASPSEF